jgi:membrane protein DedA with SNARE-associated domain
MAWEQIGDYVFVFGFLLACGLGLPVPEEIPIVVGGIKVANSWHAETGLHDLHWYVMIPVIIAGVVLSDLTLYLVGRFGGKKLLEKNWVKKFMPDDKRRKIEDNFHKHGIRILLFARLLPGLRGAIFVTAGMMKVPMRSFWIADGLYAIPGVNLIFWLSYWFTDLVREAVEKVHHAGQIALGIVLVCVVAWFIVTYLLRRRIATGDPEELPPGVKQVAQIPIPLVHDQDGVPMELTSERPPEPAAVPSPAPQVAPPQIPEPGATAVPDIGLGRIRALPSARIDVTAPSRPS